MFRNVFALGLCAILGVVALKLVFGIAGGLLGTILGLFLWFVGLALQLLLAGVLFYVVLLVVRPDLARRVRSRLNDVF